MTDLIRLAERVEALAGPDQSIDLEIAIAVWGRPGVLVLRHDEETGKNYEHTYWKYTASLDAAMTLVPEGWRHGYEQAGIQDQNPLVEAWAWPYESSWEPDWQLGYDCYRGHEQGVRAAATTPALALTAASLRSLAAQRGQG